MWFSNLLFFVSSLFICSWSFRMTSSYSVHSGAIRMARSSFGSFVCGLLHCEEQKYTLQQTLSISNILLSISWNPNFMLKKFSQQFSCPLKIRDTESWHKGKNPEQHHVLEYNNMTADQFYKNARKVETDMVGKKNHLS